MSKQFAVIGNPIEQSRSPELHHAFAAKTGVDLNYTKLLAPLDGFEANIQEFFSNGGSGMNVTVPFKEQAFAHCQVLSERAKIAKAVFTALAILARSLSTCQWAKACSFMGTVTFMPLPPLLQNS